VGLVVIVAGILILSGGGGKETTEGGGKAEVAKAAATAEKDAAAEVEKRREAAQRELKVIEDAIATSPDAYDYIAARYDALANRYRDLSSFAADCERKAGEYRERATKMAQDALAVIESEAQALVEKNEFVAAKELYEATPEDVIDRLNSRGELAERFNKRYEELSTWAEGGARLDELRRKAFKYQKQGDDSIAEQILTLNWRNEDYEGTPVGRLYDELVNQIRTRRLDELLAAEEKADREREERERLRRAEENRLREEKWQRGKEAIPFVTLLGPYDFMNWPIRFPNTIWKHSNDDGVGVLEADNRTGGMECLIGPNGPHWQDFVIRFEFRISEGSFSLSPRTQIARLPFGLSIVPPQFLRRSDPSLEFRKDEFGGDWVRATVEVHGTGPDAQVRLIVDSANTDRTVSGKDMKLLPDAGSFVVTVPQGSHVAIRKVELKLVYHTRESIYAGLERGSAESP
ncbi:MAG: hypothetical protein JXP34_01175, partial [Planctomycetes bacterium]|nr:hypothetical protein [Planctomycetota bacterium]